MQLQIVPYDDVDLYCGGLWELEPSAWMSAVDQFARSFCMGSDGEYESDDMGATARIVELSDAELVMLELCWMADQERASKIDFETRDRMRRFAASPGCVGLDTYLELNPPREYVAVVRSMNVPASERFAYIRSNDHGFYDLKMMTKEAAEAALASWVAKNVPTEEEMEMM